MTTPERIYEYYRFYVRDDLYDAAVAERDASVKLAEVRLAQFENERRAASLAEDALLKAVAERDEARRLHAKVAEAILLVIAERDEAKRIVSDLSYEFNSEPVREACETVLRRLAALERVAAAAQNVDEDADEDAVFGVYVVSNACIDELHEALSALRDAEKGDPR